MTAPGPRAKGTPERGFTLLELAVVLFVLALATTLSLPAIRGGFARVELQSEVARVSTFLRYGRAQAITTRVTHEIRLDRSAHRLTLVPLDARSPMVHRQLPSGLRIPGDADTAKVVSFSPLGFSNGAIVRLEGVDQRTYRITVDGITGRVTARRES